MGSECYPITTVPHISPLYQEYLAVWDGPAGTAVSTWYDPHCFGGTWILSNRNTNDPVRLAGALEHQQVSFGAGAATLENVAKVRSGARVVVTGQQVGLFGGPLLTLLKAATAIARARLATRSSGTDHVPVFWLATEDHDLAEVDHVTLLGKHSVETVRAEWQQTGATPVGKVPLGPEMDSLLDEACTLLMDAPVCDLLRACYAPREGYKPTLGEAYARFLTRIFSNQGLIVLDPSGREFHALGASTLRYAIEHAHDLREGLMKRTAELEANGYQAQVLVASGSSLLFLIDESTGERQALRLNAEGLWKAGGRPYATSELLEILDTAPERLSPNALLRPVFQDTILPTAAYVGGPAEIAYFAQSSVLYKAILGRVTPVLPRLSATLLEPAISTILDRYELNFPDVMTTPDNLTQRLGARSMPVENKRKLHNAGQAMDKELTALTEYLRSLDEGLGRSALVSANKMRYQMNRLRIMAANFEAQTNTSLRRHAEEITRSVYPDGHMQERLIGGIWFLAKTGDLVERLIQEAESLCAGHMLVKL